MLEHAGYWDHFLAYVDASQRPWAEGVDDSDDYRKQRALESFNLGVLTQPPLTTTPHTHLLPLLSQRRRFAVTGRLSSRP